MLQKRFLSHALTCRTTHTYTQARPQRGMHIQGRGFPSSKSKAQALWLMPGHPRQEKQGSDLDGGSQCGGLNKPGPGSSSIRGVALLEEVRPCWRKFATVGLGFESFRLAA